VTGDLAKKRGGKPSQPQRNHAAVWFRKKQKGESAKLPTQVSKSGRVEMMEDQ
jgi:hypothetical protein